MSALSLQRADLLEGAGTVSYKQAMEKAEQEYRKYQVETLSTVEEAYLETIRETEKLAKGKAGGIGADGKMEYYCLID